MLADFGPLLTFSTLRGAFVPVLLLVAVAWTASCQREGAVEPTTPAPLIAVETAESGVAEATGRPTPSPAMPAPTMTSVPVVAPSPSPISMATVMPVPSPTPVRRAPFAHPCGYGPPEIAHRRFLHWANGTSTLIVDVGEAIWGLDTGGAWVREIADLNPNPHDADRRLIWYGHHAEVSPDGSRIVYATCEYRFYGVRGEYEIAMVNPDGTGRQRLTRNGSFENFPVWSPDGTRIAFIANYDSESDPRFRE